MAGLPEGMQVHMHATQWMSARGEDDHHDHDGEMACSVHLALLKDPNLNCLKGLSQLRDTDPLNSFCCHSLKVPMHAPLHLVI